MTLRKVRSINMPNITMHPIETKIPTILMIDPNELLINDEYQRGVTERSMRLIRKIYSKWDWTKFKPPICAQTPEGLEVIDGQHTSIAAASRGIPEIPVFVTEVEKLKDRAAAFVGHNQDRLQLTLTQMYYAAVAAGDETALDISQVCTIAKVTVVKNMPPTGQFNTGETMAIGTITSLVKKRLVFKARQTLTVLVEAKCAPIRAEAIKAVDHLLFDKEFNNDRLEGKDITNTFIRVGEALYHKADVFAATHKVAKWKGLASVVFQETKSIRRRVTS